jgi:hypothetical protein
VSGLTAKQGEDPDSLETDERKPLGGSGLSDSYHPWSGVPFPVQARTGTTIRSSGATTPGSVISQPQLPACRSMKIET